jgi:hypothetical protein
VRSEDSTRTGTKILVREEMRAEVQEDEEATQQELKEKICRTMKAKEGTWTRIGTKQNR